MRWQVSWLADQAPYGRPSQVARDPVANDRGAFRSQLRGQPRLWVANHPHRIPFSSPKAEARRRNHHG
jgi:hypothetical protein